MRDSGIGLRGFLEVGVPASVVSLRCSLLGSTGSSALAAVASSLSASSVACLVEGAECGAPLGREDGSVCTVAPRGEAERRRPLAGPSARWLCSGDDSSWMDRCGHCDSLNKKINAIQRNQ